MEFRKTVERLRRLMPPVGGALALACAVLVTSSCSTRKLEIELTAGTASLAQSDPSLIDALGAYVFIAMFDGIDGVDNGCAAIMKRPIGALDNDGLAAIHVTDAIEKDSDHIFGQLKLPGPHSFVVLGSTKRRTIDGVETNHFPRKTEEQSTFLPVDVLNAAEGSVVAIGCVEQVLQYETRFDLDVVLFPAGLR